MQATAHKVACRFNSHFFTVQCSFYNNKRTFAAEEAYNAQTATIRRNQANEDLPVDATTPGGQRRRSATAPYLDLGQ